MYKKSRQRTRLCRIYWSMLDRCRNPNNKHYADYGGRGISVCAEWLRSSKVFYEWASATGYADGLTIDRIDNNKNYEPNNCRWATQKEQQNNRGNNRYLTVDGVTRSIIEWSELTGLRYITIWQRIYKSGWSPEDAVSTPSQKGKTVP